MLKKLTETCAHWYRLASVWLAGVVAIIAGILTANPNLLLGLIGYLPEGNARYIASAVVTLLVFVVPVIVRLWPQPKLEEKLRDRP